MSGGRGSVEDLGGDPSSNNAGDSDARKDNQLRASQGLLALRRLLVLQHGGKGLQHESGRVVAAEVIKLFIHLIDPLSQVQCRQRAAYARDGSHTNEGADSPGAVASALFPPAFNVDGAQTFTLSTRESDLHALSASTIAIWEKTALAHRFELCDLFARVSVIDINRHGSNAESIPLHDMTKSFVDDGAMADISGAAA